SFSDVFEEQGVVRTPFYGGFGLIAAGGIPKASFNAFALLHRLGEQRFSGDPEGTLFTRRPDGTLVVAVWNYVDVGASVAPRHLTLTVTHMHASRAKIETLD